MRKMVLALLLLGSLAFAIAPVENWTLVSTGRYTQTPAAGYVTEGGNVTNLDLRGNVSTEKWAGYWGNVSGLIVLAPSAGASLFYSWAWDSSRGGEVCAIAASSGFDWAGLQQAAASAIDSVWAFGAATDNATNTFNETCTNVDIAGINVASTAGSLTGLRNDFRTCALADQASPAAKQDLAF